MEDIGMLKDTHARTLAAIKHHFQHFGYSPTVSEILMHLPIEIT